MYKQENISSTPRTLLFHKLRQLVETFKCVYVKKVTEKNENLNWVLRCFKPKTSQLSKNDIGRHHRDGDRTPTLGGPTPVPRMVENVNRGMWLGGNYTLRR